MGESGEGGRRNGRFGDKWRRREGGERGHG